MSIIAFLGIGSAVLNTLGLFPYIQDILRHKTKPERATWWIWLLLNAIALIAQLAAGATWSVFLTVGNIIAVGIIAVLSLFYGYGSFKRRDGISILVAVIGALLSILLKSPLLALLAVIAVDVTGYGLTLVKSWEAPHTETLVSWYFATVSALMGTFSVGTLSFTKLVYPLYILIGDALLVAVIIYRRKKLTI